MELSKGPVPSVARGVPMPFLDPAGHLHPAISSPLPPWGSNTWAFVRAPGVRAGKPADPSCRNPPLRRSPFLPSVKGSRLRTGRTWGGPQELAFLPATAGSFRAYTWAAHAHSGSQAHTSLGSPDPPFRGHSSSSGSLGTCLWTQEPSLPPRGPRDFRWGTLPRSTPTLTQTLCAG